MKATTHASDRSGLLRSLIAPWPLAGAARWVPTIVRFYLAVVFWYHGWGKLGDPSEWVTRRVEGGVPGWLAWIAVFAESVGAVLMALGAFARFAAALLICQMIGAIWLVHWDNGMFGRGGYEFNLGLIVLSLVVLVLGAGAASVDGVLASRERPASGADDR